MTLGSEVGVILEMAASTGATADEVIDGERESEKETGDQTQTVVAGEGGACSLPEVGGGV